MATGFWRAAAGPKHTSSKKSTSFPRSASSGPRQFGPSLFGNAQDFNAARTISIFSLRCRIGGHEVAHDRSWDNSVGNVRWMADLYRFGPDKQTTHSQGDLAGSHGLSDAGKAAL